MKTPTRTSLLLSPVLLMVGCATEITVRDALPVPQERVFFKVLPKSSDPARATFVRDAWLLPTAPINIRISVNGEFAAAFAAGERWEVALDPGDYLFGLRVTTLEGEPMTFHERIIDQTLLPGTRYQYRMLLDPAIGWLLQRAPVEQK